MDGLVRDQVDAGIKRDQALARARKAMLERDRRLEERGKR